MPKRRHNWDSSLNWRGKKTGQEQCKDCECIKWTLNVLGANSADIIFYRFSGWVAGDWTTERMECHP